MNPVSIGTNTHATRHADGAHHGHGAKAHGSHGKKDSPFESSLEGALADDDASKLEGESTEADEKKAALGAAPPPGQSPQDLAAALALAAQAKPAVATDAPAEGDDAKVDGKKTEKTAAIDPKLAVSDIQDDALKALAPTKTLAGTAADLPDDAAKNAKTAKIDASDAPAAAAPPPPVAPAPVAPPPATSAPGPTAEAIAKTRDVKVPAPAKSSATKTESVDRATGSKPSTTTAEASTSAPAKVSEADAPRAQSDAKDAPGGDTGAGAGSGDRRGDKPARTTLAQADKKAKIERAKTDDMSADAARVTATVADPSTFTAPVVNPTDTAKTMTPALANGADGSKVTENTISGADGVSTKTDDAIRAAEAAGHKRTLASGEARGELVTPELGRIEVVAHAIGGASEAGRVEVHVRAVEEHAKQVIAANAESLREHVRVEVPNATVHVQKPSNDLLGNGTSGRDFGNNTAGNTARDGDRDGRGDAPGPREATVKNPALPVKGARVRFVL